MSAAIAWLDRFAWWQRASPRERAIVGGGVAVVVAAIAVSVIVLPLRDALAHAPAERAQRKALLAQAEQRAAIIQTIPPQPPAAVDARTAIERALDRHGIARGDATIDTANDRIALTLPATRIADVAAVVDALMRDGLRVNAATLAARADSADVRAEIAFARTDR
ncbi:MAG: type II secretion system protein GspM [Betaproteobacteria bacterium]